MNSDRTPFILRVADFILGAHCDSLIGDLEWSWRTHREERGRLAAWFWLLGTLLTLVPRIIFRDLIWNQIMFKNYALVALRLIKKYKSFSAINVLGLALSMSVCLLIITFLSNFGSNDSFHPNADRIYRLTTEQQSQWGTMNLATSSVMAGPETERQFDGIENLVQMMRSADKLTADNGRMAAYRGLYATPSFFDVFGFDVIQGNRHQLLVEPNQIVLKEKLALQLFPDGNALGQIVSRESGDYEVVGIVAEPPSKSHISFEALLSFSSLNALVSDNEGSGLGRWDINTAYYNYFLLAPGVSTGKLEGFINQIEGLKAQRGENGVPQYELQSVMDVNLGKDLSNEIGRVVPREFAWVLSVLAFLLVGTAVFNYMNLTVSRSLKRKAEIGVRKVVGAHKRQLIHQFVTESVITSLLSLGLAFVFLQWLIPQFNTIGSIREDEMMISMSTMDPWLIAKFILFAATLGLFAGLLPALRISKFNPVALFRGSASGRGSSRLWGRKAVVVIQFTLSIVALVTVAVVYRQSTMILAADLGFDSEQILHVSLENTSFDPFALELGQIPGVISVSGISHSPSSSRMDYTDIRTPEMEDELLIQRFGVDDQFIDQYNLKLIAGRNFSRDIDSDREHSIILTEKGVLALGMGTPEEAVGREVVFDSYTYEARPVVVGVIADFYSNGYSDGFKPVSLSYRPEYQRVASILIAPGDPRPVLTDIEKAWATHAPGMPINYRFLDDEIQSSISYLKDAASMIGFFGVIISVIACLGLLGMAMFSSEIRLKEVGIRKTLGAGQWQLVRLLSGEYVVLMSIAVAIGAPAAWGINSLILSTFANRIDLSLGILLIGILPIAMLALVTIGSQTIKAASANPVDVMTAE